MNRTTHHEGTKSTKFGNFIIRNLRVLSTTIADNLRGLPKCQNTPTNSESDIPLAKAQRRQVRKSMVKIINRDSDSPTFASLAPLREIFRNSVAAEPR